MCCTARGAFAPPVRLSGCAVHGLPAVGTHQKEFTCVRCRFLAQMGMPFDATIVRQHFRSLKAATATGGGGGGGSAA